MPVPDMPGARTAHPPTGVTGGQRARPPARRLPGAVDTGHPRRNDRRRLGRFRLAQVRTARDAVPRAYGHADAGRQRRRGDALLDREPGLGRLATRTVHHPSPGAGGTTRRTRACPVAVAMDEGEMGITQHPRDPINALSTRRDEHGGVDERSNVPQLRSARREALGRMGAPRMRHVLGNRTGGGSNPRRAPAATRVIAGNAEKGAKCDSSRHRARWQSAG